MKRIILKQDSMRYGNRYYTRGELIEAEDKHATLLIAAGMARAEKASATDTALSFAAQVAEDVLRHQESSPQHRALSRRQRRDMSVANQSAASSYATKEE